ncbi:hypothetical protein FRC14_002149 [Serendipita sp. 396]|nr:hypothetical protein FRC14_002149 [Serendipita sp. 396]KAG8786424.1 hypothetical protein FRC15_011453 [Serendipita sp. 397]KAG8801776.1 hypothetical protein FRC16_011159 [Serendipita sp. 398]KAG8813165.1 hypothetical protein FRC18_002638 [Serendipita sp. 400]KAG8825094.1 hypothetical protein FRC19_000419 [Serendipita sp. 401]KAG8846496.1 hypothetical protein FRB91_000749 [Serendipita sp. 411]KAG8870453.1 hypothetical protein FRC20_011813 [Serendipita sp. 405]KAG9055894.1 hypothetical prot
MLWRMKFDSWIWIWIMVILRVLSGGVYAAHNVTVDDADPSITYTGTWLTTDRTERYMSTSHFTRVQGSYATFSFTGATQIHFMGLGNTNTDVDTDIAIVLDGRTYTVDIYRAMSDHVQAILWSSDVLDPNMTHTLECRKTSVDKGGRDLNVDAFVLTIPDVVAPAPSSARTSTTTQANPSASSNSSSRSATALNTSNPSGVGAAIAGASTVASGITSNAASNIVWNPSLSTDTQYVPVPTLESHSDGNVEASIGGSSGSDSLSKSAIASIVFGVIGLLCLIAIIFFYLGRRRKSLQQLGTPQLYYLSHKELNEAHGNSHQTDRSVFLEPAQANLKQRQHSHEVSHQRGPSSSISSDNTRSHSGRIRVSLVASEGVLETVGNNTWTTGPPAYTVHPIIGHYTSTTAPRIGETSMSPYQPRQIRDVKEDRRLW